MACDKPPNPAARRESDGLSGMEPTTGGWWGADVLFSKKPVERKMALRARSRSRLIAMPAIYEGRHSAVYGPL